jgi:simple sugar transport system permease protein
LHLGFAIAVVACIAAWWIIANTAAGFRLIVIGDNPRAARVTGEIDVPRVATRALILSGALAGVAGAIELSGVTHALYENISPGYGFTAIAVALLAGLRPLAIIATGILFGAMQAGGATMQREADVPSVLVSVLEATIILSVLAFRRIDLQRMLPVAAAGLTRRRIAGDA